jgi:hypothetical protein
VLHGRGSRNHNKESIARRLRSAEFLFFAVCSPLAINDVMSRTAVPMLRQTNLLSHFSRSQPHPHGVAVASVDDQTASKRGRTTEELVEQYASKLSKFKRVRASYNDEEKKVIGEVIVSCEYNCLKALRVLEQSTLNVGYSTLWRIRNEMQGKRLRRKRGRPVDDDFERAVLTKVIVQVLDKGLNQDGSILGNIMHSLQVIVIEPGPPISIYE